MTRQECEKRIADNLKEIDAVVRQYNPTNTYLSMCIINRDGDTYISFNNAHWVDDDDKGEDYEHPIDHFTTMREDGTTNA